jgi:multiple sugar transport system ATP-binding protein
VPATALVVEPTGVETHMLMRLGESQVLGIFRERLALRPGDTFTVSVDPRLVHLFGADGVRIES